jgi:hypothetical protein
MAAVIGKDERLSSSFEAGTYTIELLLIFEVSTKTVPSFIEV